MLQTAVKVAVGSDDAFVSKVRTEYSHKLTTSKMRRSVQIILLASALQIELADADADAADVALSIRALVPISGGALAVSELAHDDSLEDSDDDDAEQAGVGSKSEFESAAAIPGTATSGVFSRCDNRSMRVKMRRNLHALAAEQAATVIASIAEAVAKAEADANAEAKCQAAATG
jgi:hypothetical protein